MITKERQPRQKTEWIYVVPETIIPEFAGINNLRIVRRGSVGVIFFDHEYSKLDIMDQPNRHLNQIASNPMVRGIISEYFLPELLNNAGVWKDFLESSLIDHPDGAYGKRLQWADELARLSKDTGKPAYVMDIASKPSYMVFKNIISLLPNNILLLNAFATGNISLSLLFTLVDVGSFISFTNTVGADTCGNCMESIINGYDDSEKIHRLETLTLYLEDARRYFVAEGLNVLAKEFDPQGKGQKIEHLLFCPQPPAHNIRVENHLLNPNPFYKAKALFWQMFGHIPFDQNLEIAVRTWEWKNKLIPGWLKTSDRPIPFI